MERPVPCSITEVHFDADSLISEQDQVQEAVPVEIGELDRHIAVLPRKNLFREPAPAVAQEGLHPAEVTGRHDVRESVAVDIPRGEGGVADIAPRGLDRSERSFAVAPPHV